MIVLKIFFLTCQILDLSTLKLLFHSKRHIALSLLLSSDNGGVYIIYSTTICSRFLSKGSKMTSFPFFIERNSANGFGMRTSRLFPTAEIVVLARRPQRFRFFTSASIASEAADSKRVSPQCRQTLASKDPMCSPKNAYGTFFFS